ncbi:MAG: hypothetical protein ACE5H3_10970, partial [Planctomycetota bacterium]
LRQLQARARLPRAILSRTARILLAQLRMDPPEWMRHRRGSRAAASERILEMDCFDDALDCLRCRLEADGRDMRPYDAWRERSLSREPDGR